MAKRGGQMLHIRFYRLLQTTIPSPNSPTPTCFSLPTHRFRRYPPPPATFSSYSLGCESYGRRSSDTGRRAVKIFLAFLAAVYLPTSALRGNLNYLFYPVKCTCNRAFTPAV